MAAQTGQAKPIWGGVVVFATGQVARPAPPVVVFTASGVRLSSS